MLIIALLGCTMMVEAATFTLEQGDPELGKAVYTQCMGCHSPKTHRTGPKHCGLIGRQAGTAEGYVYSKAMQERNIVWTAQTLERFLYSPLGFVPGTRMGIAGIKGDQKRRDLIAYLIAMNGQQECR